MTEQSRLVKVTIDDVPVEVPNNTLLIEAAGTAGVHIPRFCYHPKLSLAGACRICSVSVEKMPKLQTACTTPVADGMIAKTNTPEVADARRSVLEFLLLNHPLDCPVCDAAGECPLQDYSHLYGPDASRSQIPKRRAPKAERLSPLVVLDMERCILCYRCTRFMDEVAGDAELAFYDRGATSVLGTFDGAPLTSRFQGNIVELCPCGALTSEPYRFRARPQDLAFGDSICGHCAVGCAVRYEARRGEVVRVKPRQHEAVNEVWLCDKGYFGIEYVSQAPRLEHPLVRSGDSLVPARWNDVLDLLADRLRQIATRYGPDAIGVIGGTRITNEECALVHRVFAKGLGTPHVDHRSAARQTGGALLDLAGLPVPMTDVEKADAIVLVALDPTEELPILWLRMRKAIRRGASLVIVSSRPIDAERDAAIVVRADVGGEVDALAELAAQRPHLLVESKRPLFLGGSTLESRVDGEAVARAIANFAREIGGPDAPRRAGILMRAPNAMGALRAGLVPGERGVAGGQIIASAAEGRLRALYLIGVDPLRTFPDRELVERALGRVDFLVVQDIAPSATAGKAHVVLPAAALPEKEGTITNVEGRAQRLEPVVQPPGEARSDLAILVDLAGRLDLREPSREFLARAPGRVPEVAALLPAAGAPGPGTRMATAPGGVYGVYASATPQTRGITTQKPFFAPGGWPLGMPGSARVSPIHLGASLAAVPLSAGEEILRTSDQPHGVADPGVLEPPARDALGPYEPLPGRRPEPGDGIVLLTAPLLIGGGTMLARSERLLSADAHGTIALAPRDAEARGIAEGALVTVASRYGRVSAYARIDPRMPAGRAFLAENAPGVPTSRLLAWHDPQPRVEVTPA
ncbi:MAG TPA: NADH-quinone oxidoreductase subunit NuoG [Candidatus Limnocylindria bacterium]|nr:NADH-quinone oxidoreductase subunit NuoG [Candidatus Limnocylindria bacterium]